MKPSIAAAIAATSLAWAVGATAATANFTATGALVGAPVSWELNGLPYTFSFVVEDKPLFPPVYDIGRSAATYGVQAFTISFERLGEQHRYEAQANTNPSSPSFGYVGTVSVERIGREGAPTRDSLRYNASTFVSTGAAIDADGATYTPISVGGVFTFDTLNYLSSLDLPPLNFQDYVGPPNTYEALMLFQRDNTSAQVRVQGDFTSFVNDVSPVPEPGTMALGGMGLLLTVSMCRRGRQLDQGLSNRGSEPANRS